jgi:hypothetical protein
MLESFDVGGRLWRRLVLGLDVLGVRSWSMALLERVLYRRS